MLTLNSLMAQYQWPMSPKAPPKNQAPTLAKHSQNRTMRLMLMVLEKGILCATAMNFRGKVRNRTIKKWDTRLVKPFLQHDKKENVKPFCLFSAPKWHIFFFFFFPPLDMSEFHHVPLRSFTEWSWHIYCHRFHAGFVMHVKDKKKKTKLKARVLLQHYTVPLMILCQWPTFLIPPHLWVYLSLRKSLATSP